MTLRAAHIIPFLLLALSAGCEQAVDIDDLPQEEEKLVVFGGLCVTPDSVHTSFWFQRTGPLSASYQGSEHIVANVDFDLRGGDGPVPLRPTQWPGKGGFGFVWQPQLASSQRGGARGRETDFVLTFHWKDRDIPVSLHAPRLPVTLEDLQKRSVLVNDSVPVFELSWTYPVFSRDEYVSISFQQYDVARSDWEYSSYTGHIYPGFGQQRNGRLHNTTQLHRYDEEGRELRYRYRVYVRDEVYGFAERNLVTGIPRDENEVHPVFRPTGTNPPFNVRGDGIGFVWYERFGEWTEIP